MEYTYDSQTVRLINKLIRRFKKEHPKVQYDNEAIRLSFKVIGFYLGSLAAAFMAQFFFFEYLGGITYLFYLFPGYMLPPVFMIQHDCGHESFHSSKKVRDRIGLVCSMLTIIPYVAWSVEHAIHHLNNAVHNFKNFGDILTYTLKEYLALSYWEKIYYKFFRSPFGFLLLGSLLYPFYYQRFSPVNARDYSGLNQEQSDDIKQKLRKSKKSYRATNISLLCFYGLLTYVLGFQFLFGVCISIWVFGVVAMWFFYVQHQHPEAYKYHLMERESTEETLYHKAALKGSVVYDLPNTIRKHMLYITDHPPHHYHEKLSCMELRDFMKFLHKESNQGDLLCRWILGQSPKVTFLESFKLLRCNVYDNERKIFLSFHQAKEINNCKRNNHKRMINIPAIQLSKVLNKESFENWVIQKQCTCCKAVVEIRDGIEKTIEKGIFHITQSKPL